MFSATRFVVAGAIVALFGGFLLAGLLTQPSDQAVPAATTDASGTFSPTGTLVEPDSCCSDTIPLRDGRVLVVGGASAEFWDPDTGMFSPAFALGEIHGGATTTLLPDGRVLVVGGATFPSERGRIRNDPEAARHAALDQLPDVDPGAEAQVWDPASELLQAAGSLAHGRWGHSAALLPDGRVLIVGGEDDGPVAAAEVWDPESMAFGPAGSLNEPRIGHSTGMSTIVLLDGRVLVVGGGNDDGPVGAAEVWDPETATFSLAGSLGQLPHGANSTATLLEDGRVLFVGGEHAQIWDPKTMAFGPGGSLFDGRWDHSATHLPDGRVLVIGGWHGDLGRKLASAELWDPASETFSRAGSLPEPRSHHRATHLPDGRILVVGGGNPSGEVAAAELWDPVTETFSPAGSVPEAWIVQSATLLPDGRVLVFGTDDTVTTAEVWSP